MPTEDERKFLPKAYDNEEFLHGAHARSLRILSEYLEPQARLRHHKIRGTIVMFGSARAVSPEDLPQKIAEVREKMKGATPDQVLRHQKRITAMERMSRYYSEAVVLSRMLTEHFHSLPDHRDRHVVCSGGGPGMMEAANRGAHEAGGKTLGLSISLPHEQGHNLYLDPKLTFEFHYFFMRKYWFMYLARALVVFPGGFGTMDELFEILTLVQTEKVRKKMPIVFYGARYWENAISFETMIDWGVISPEDVNLFRICDTPEEAFEYLKAGIHVPDMLEPEHPHGE